MKTIKSTVQGSIHGVGFKFFILKTALSYHIGGFVKNEKDGTMSITAYGADEKVDAFFNIIEVGNGYSKVDFMTLTDSPLEIYSDFKVVY